MSLRKAPLPGQGGRGLRERQSVWCCGVNFQRWRFTGEDFPGTHHTHCFHCGKPLRWPDQRKTVRLAADKKLAHRRKTFLLAYYRRADRNQRAGLTAHGTPPKSKLTPTEQAWQELRAGMGEIIVPEPTASCLRYE